LQQLPKDYKVVLLKNEYGDVEGESSSSRARLRSDDGKWLTPVDSLLAKQSNITGVSEILNGCLCV
jgi:hypothetical protein